MKKEVRTTNSTTPSALDRQLSAVVYADNVFKHIPEISSGAAAVVKAQLANGTLDISAVNFESLLGKKTGNIKTPTRVSMKPVQKATTITTPKKTVTGNVLVSELAKRAGEGITPQMMNEALIEGGYQTRDVRKSGKGFDYHVTERGKNYAAAPLVKRNDGRHDFIHSQYLRWSPTILEEFKQLEEK